MGLLYDSRTKRPQLWTIILIIVLPPLMIWGVYAYGEFKAKGKPSPTETNGMFEGAIE
jgi:hypothetical protein